MFFDNQFDGSQKIWCYSFNPILFVEWIDFPRVDQRLPNGQFVPGNNFSYDKCRRRFDLVSFSLGNGMQVTILKEELTDDFTCFHVGYNVLIGL